MIHDHAHVVYLINLVIGDVALVWMIVRLSSRWTEYPNEMHWILGSRLALLLALIATSATMLVLDRPLSVDAFFITAAKILTIVSLWGSKDALFRTSIRHNDSGDSEDVNRDYHDDQ